MFSDGHLDNFAPQATPELQELFSEWLRATEDRVLDLIVQKTTDAIAAVLKLSEPSVRYILTHLAEAGKITLSAVATK